MYACPKSAAAASCPVGLSWPVSLGKEDDCSAHSMEEEEQEAETEDLAVRGGKEQIGRAHV